MFRHNHFTEKGLFVYLSSFLEKTIAPFVMLKALPLRLKHPCEAGGILA